MKSAEPSNYATARRNILIILLRLRSLISLLRWWWSRSIMSWVGNCEWREGAADDRGARAAKDVRPTWTALVCNAGLSMRGAVADTQLAVDHELMNTNYFGNVALTKAVLPHLLQLALAFHPATARPARAGRQPALHVVGAGPAGGAQPVGVQRQQARAARLRALAAVRAAQHCTHCCICPGYVATSLSLHALAADGGKWGKLDANYGKSGMSADSVAERMVARPGASGVDEVWMCDAQTRVGIWLQWIAPRLLKSIMRKRGEKEQAANAANKGKVQ